MSSLKNLAPLDVEMKTTSISDIEAELNELGVSPAAVPAAAAPATPAAPAAAATPATPKASPAAAARAALVAAAARVPAATPATPKAKNPVLPVVPNADAQRALRATVKSAVELLRSVDKDELIEEFIAADATGALTDQLLVIAKRASTPKVKKPVVPKRAKPTVVKVELWFEDFYAQIKASVANLDKFADLRPHIVADVATVARIRGAASDAAITMELRGVTSCIDTTKQIQLHNYFVLGCALEAAHDWFMEHRNEIANTFATWIASVVINGNKPYSHSYSMKLIALARLCKTFPRLQLATCHIGYFLDLMPMLGNYLLTDKTEARYWTIVRSDEATNSEGVVRTFQAPQPFRVDAYNPHEFPDRLEKLKEIQKAAQAEEVAVGEAEVEEEMQMYRIPVEEALKRLTDRDIEAQEY